MRIDQHQHSTVAPQIHNRRILVIDDDPAILELFSRTFVYKNQWIEEFSDLFDLETGEFDLSFELSTASQGEEGVALIQQAVDESAPFALVFLDVRLPPGIDGLETARKIREIDSDVHIVISSAYTDYQPSDFRVVVFSHLYFMRKPLVVAEIEHMAYNASYSWNRNRQLQQELDTNIAYQSWLSQLFNELPMPIMVIDTTNHQVLMSGGTYHSDTSKSSCYKMRYNRDTPCD
ncbi:MAG: response regulator, partial [Gammaproteobacteria bacterium]|nr:response regulator [Gammaproteobacteria bacterium]